MPPARGDSDTFVIKLSDSGVVTARKLHHGLLATYVFRVCDWTATSCVAAFAKFMPVAEIRRRCEAAGYTVASCVAVTDESKNSDAVAEVLQSGAHPDQCGILPVGHTVACVVTRALGAVMATSKQLAKRHIIAKKKLEGEIKRIKVRFFATMLKTMALTAALQDEMSEMLKKNNEIVALQSRLRSSTDANSSLRKTCVNLHQRRVVACGDMAERLRDAEKRAQATAEELNAAEADISAKDRELAELQKANEDLRAEITRALNEKIENARIVELEEELAGKDAEMTRITEAKEEAEQDGENLRNEIDERTAGFEALMREFDGALTMHDDLRDDIHAGRRALQRKMQQLGDEMAQFCEECVAKNEAIHTALVAAVAGHKRAREE